MTPDERARFEEHEKEESKEWWWKSWTGVKVLPCPDQSMRKLFTTTRGVWTSGLPLREVE